MTARMSSRAASPSLRRASECGHIRSSEKIRLSLWSGKGLLPSSQLPILNSEAAKPSAGWKKSKGAVANSRKASSGNRLSLSSLQPGGHPRGGQLPDKDSSRAWPGRPWPASLTDTWTPCRMWAPGIVQSKAGANREKGRNPEADLNRGSEECWLPGLAHPVQTLARPTTFPPCFSPYPHPQGAQTLPQDG